MSSPAYDIATYLQTQGVGTLGTDMFVSEMPDDPDDCVVLYDYAGQPSTKGDGTIHRPSIQIAVRAQSYPNAYDKMEIIQNLLHGLNNTTLNGSYYLNIFNLQAPFFDRRDEHRRETVKQNYSIMKR